MHNPVVVHGVGFVDAGVAAVGVGQQGVDAHHISNVDSIRQVVVRQTRENPHTGVKFVHLRCVAIVQQDSVGHGPTTGVGRRQDGGAGGVEFTKQQMVRRANNFVLGAFQHLAWSGPVVDKQRPDIRPRQQIIRGAVIQYTGIDAQILLGRYQHVPLVVLPINVGIPEVAPDAILVPYVNSGIGLGYRVIHRLGPLHQIIGKGQADRLVEIGVTSGVGNDPPVVALVAKHIRCPDGAVVPGSLTHDNNGHRAVPMLQVLARRMPNRIAKGGAGGLLVDGVIKNVVDRIGPDDTEVPHLASAVLEIFLFEVEADQRVGLGGEGHHEQQSPHAQQDVAATNGWEPPGVGGVVGLGAWQGQAPGGQVVRDKLHRN